MLRLFLSWILLLLGTSVLSAFDGEVVMQTTIGDQKVDTMFVAKGDKLRFNMPKGQGTLILDSKAKSMTIIMDEQHMYMVQPLDRKQIGSQADGEIKDTGEKAEIFGLNARKIIFTEPNGKRTEIWATIELQNEALTNMPGMNDKLLSQVEDIFGSKQVFPLKMTVFSPDGTIEMSMNVTEIKERVVKDSELSIPDGYTEYKVPTNSATSPAPR